MKKFNYMTQTKTISNTTFTKYEKSI